jgi:VIT1/CCC1 family predicted Fe2+/Mn2+ transporter
MKTMMNVKTLMMLVMMSMLAVTVSAQRMHKHPRVTVKANKVTLNKKGSKDAEKVMMPATATLMQEENVANAESETLVNEVAVATTETKAEVKNARKNIVKSVVVNEVKQIFDFSTYAQQLKEHSRLMKVKEVEKTALEKWLMWMIILLAAAFFFTILAVIFGYAVYVPALWIIFWILAGLCWTGAIIVLILGITGVI